MATAKYYVAVFDAKNNKHKYLLPYNNGSASGIKTINSIEPNALGNLIINSDAKSILITKKNDGKQDYLNIETSLGFQSLKNEMHIINEYTPLIWDDMNKDWNIFGNVRQLVFYGIVGQPFQINAGDHIIELDRKNWTSYHYFVGELKIVRKDTTRNNDIAEIYPCESDTSGKNVILSSYTEQAWQPIKLNAGDIVIFSALDVHSQTI